jgi:glycosyltransferase involved in cell wall biosynthesis
MFHLFHLLLLYIPTTPFSYTLAVNSGLRAAHEAGFKYIAQLNSDTLLTPNWLPPLLSVLDNNPRAGAVGPLSNAATWQSVPEIITETGGWNLNPLPAGATPDMMAKLVRLVSDGNPIEIPILNGFVILYRGQVFHDVGYMDEVLSPRGYGEENDFAFRLRQQNYTLWVAPNSYVFHHKGKSFNKEEYVTQIAVTKKNMKERYGQELKEAEVALRGNDGLSQMRTAVQANLLPSIPSLMHDMSALFILNCMSTKKPFMLHGGWISLVQEALGLWRNGCYSRIAVPMGYLEQFNLAFPEADAAGTFIGFVGKTPDAVAEEFAQKGQLFDFLVATHSSTAITVKELIRHWPNAVPSYYIQDIETAFNDITAKEAAMQSYKDFSEGFIFVKTPWLQDELLKQFNIKAHLIPPTVDTDLFVPGKQTYSGSLQLCAMVRTSTPRRNPRETLEILSWAAETLGVKAIAYGSSLEDITGCLRKTVQTDVRLSLIHVLGILDRQAMHDVNQICEIFLDFSSWQAFGRSGIEAMASGVIPILPQKGGASTYAKAGENAFLIDTSDIDGVKTLLKEIAEGKYDLAKMREAALATADNFSIDNAEKKTYRTFRDFLHGWQRKRIIDHFHEEGGRASVEG